MMYSRSSKPHLPFQPSGYQRASQPVPEGGGAGELHLSQVLGTLRRRWWLLVTASAAFLLVAWFALPPDLIRYEARAVVRLTDSKRALTGNLDAAQPDNLAAGDYLASQLAVIRSRALLGDAVQRYGLRLALPPELQGLVVDVTIQSEADADSLRLAFSDRDYTAWSGEAETTAEYGQPVEVAGVRFTLNARPAMRTAEIPIISHETAVDLLLTGLRAMPRDRSPVIDIAYRDVDPRRAQLVVNEITRAFQEHNARSVREQSQRRRQFIEEQLEQMEARLGEAQGALTAFRSSGNSYSSRDRLLAEQTSLMNLEVRREELDVDRRMLRMLLSRVEQASDRAGDQEMRTVVSSPGITANPVVAQLFNQYVQYQTERNGLLADGRSSTHPDVERVTTLVASTRAELINAVRSHIASLDARVAALDDLRGRTAASIRDLPAAETAESHLVQEVETVRRMADLLRDEYQRARIAEAVEVGQVEILDLATFATPLGGAGRNQRLVMALFLGLVLGGSGAIVAERLRPSIRRREDLEELLQVPGLAVIPAISRGERGWLRRYRIPRALIGDGNERAQRLVAKPGQDSFGAEAYRVLRTNLIFSNLTENVKSVVVTSAASGEGKTTTAANLGISLAHQGMRVLLIDCDLRRPQLHRVFGVDRDPGFTELLLGKATATAVTRSTPIERLWVVPRGRFDREALEVLGRPQMRSCLTELSRVYDMIILDTPPILVAADAAALGAVADGVLLVIRAGRTNRNDVRYASQQLTTVGGTIVGSVLNDPDGAMDRYGGYYQYGYAVAE